MIGYGGLEESASHVILSEDISKVKDGDGGILRLYRNTELNLGVETRAKTQEIACCK